MRLVYATEAETPHMAGVHAQAFDTPWRQDEFEDLLEGEGIFGLLATGEAGPMGVILCRIAADEMEVLTLGVAPFARRSGVGLALLAEALDEARRRGTVSAFLEVDVGNPGAVSLYERLGFARAGLRKGYYDRGAAGRADALVMRLDLNAAPA